MPALAVDIGTYSLKVLSGKPGAAISVEKAVSVFNTAGVVLPADDVQFQKLSELLNTLVADHKLSLTDVRLSLPETVVSSKVISLPYLSDAELASAMQWQAEQYIPIPPEQLSLEYQVLFRPDKNDKNAQMRVLLVGTRKDVVEKYTNVFLHMGIEPRVVETHMLSLMRSQQFTPEDPPTLVMEMGATNTQISVVHQGEIQFVTSILSGGEVLTKALERTVGLESKQAEAYKRTYGLLENQFEGKVRQALLPAVEVLLGEMKKALTFFSSQHPGISVQRIILSGGGAQLPGLVQHITQQLGAEVLMASPFSHAEGVLPETEHPVWSICVGLLMREE